ncbi:hypothetical protein LEP1GSC127_4992, partial [Leptospira kirschneri str. 200801925]
HDFYEQILKILGTPTFKKIFTRVELTLKWDLNFYDGRKTAVLCKNRMTMIFFYFIVVPTD